MQLDFDTCAVRAFRDADAQELARYANNRQVWLQLPDRFPSPHMVENAREYIAHLRSRTPATAFAVTVGDAPVGAIGVMLHDDVERCSAEVSYVLEGRMRRSAIKDSVPQDQLLYAVLRGDEAPSTTRS